MLPPRYFAGRAPAPRADSSSDEEGEAAAKPAQPPASRKRARFVARVVSRPPPVAPPPDARRRAPTAAFVPVGSGGGRSAEREGEESSEEESSSESDGTSSGSDSGSDEREKSAAEEEEDEEDDVAVPRPLFVPRHLRTSQAALEVEGTQMAAARAAEDKAARRREAQRLVAHILTEEENTRDAWASVTNDELPDDEDREEDHEMEVALWRLREVRRVKRDREERADWERKRGGEVVEPRKDRGEGEGRAETKEAGEGQATAKPAFLQKHYKMGPFFLETNEDGTYKEEIYNRDYNRGIEEDQVRRLGLPGPMQVRRGEFGKAGRSKYTHLAAEDTAAGMARELRQDRELADVLRRNERSRKT